MSGIGENIRKARLDRGMSQDALARIVDTAANYIGAFETGARKPGRKMVTRLALALGVSEQELEYGENMGLAVGDSMWDQMAWAAWQKLPEAAKKKLLPSILAEVPEGQESSKVPPHANGQQGSGGH